MTGHCQFCNIEHSIAVPCIHSNGTNTKELREQIDAAILSLRGAIKAVGKAAPNARDYYLTNDLQQAIKEHCIRADKLRRMAMELCHIRDHIYEVMEFKDSQRKNA